MKIYLYDMPWQHNRSIGWSRSLNFEDYDIPLQ